MYKVVLLRHGESTWNLENRFTGWTDVDLSLRGIAEAHRAGLLLKADGYVFDEAFTSVLKRAIRTLWIALDEMDLMWIPVCHSWRLNDAKSEQHLESIVAEAQRVVNNALCSFAAGGQGAPVARAEESSSLCRN